MLESWHSKGTVRRDVLSVNRRTAGLSFGVPPSAAEIFLLACQHYK